MNSEVLLFHAHAHFQEAQRFKSSFPLTVSARVDVKSIHLLSHWGFSIT